MRGDQGPGDARGGRVPAHARPRVRSRQVYTARRLLAAMILLLLLVLLVPRACQALLGSEDAGPGVDQGQRTPGKAAPAAGVAEDAAEKADKRDNSAGDKATGKTRDAGSEEAREVRDSREQADEADKDLGEILIENLAVVVTEPAEPGGDEAIGSADTSVDLPMLTPTYVGDQWQVDRLVSMNQLQAPAPRRAAPRRAASGRQPSESRSAPADRPGTGSSNTVTPVKRPPPGPENGPAPNQAITTVAAVPQPVLEPSPAPAPVQASAPMVKPVPVPPRPAVAAPVRRAPLPVVRGIPGRRVGASVGASVGANAPNVAAGFGRGVVGARANNAAAFPRAGVVRGAMRR